MPESPFRGPAPKSLLRRHRVLSLSASVRVSPLLLGTTNFGTNWNQYMGECSKETAFEILDLYCSQGGNFIDTANNYQEGETEDWLGEWLSTRKNRDEIVLATKFSGNHLLIHAKPDTILSNYGGNNSKALKLTVENSFAKLRTSYLNILYVHWWGFVTSPAADDLAQPARGGRDRLVSRSIRHASLGAADREMEREILAICESEQTAVAPWEVLGGGRFKSAEQIKNQKEGDSRMELHPGREEAFERVEKVLRRIGEEMGTLPTSVALAYVMRKQAYVFPLVGGRKVDHLKANIEV
ncbi:Aldo/keto reductase [Hyaloscypha variabilis]